MCVCVRARAHGGRTLGKFTLGTMTTLTALGASLGSACGSPPGWYWYLPSPAPVSHGMPELAMPTFSSEVEPVGERPVDGKSIEVRNCKFDIKDCGGRESGEGKEEYQSKDRHHPKLEP